MTDPVIRACRLQEQGRPKQAFRVLLRAAQHGDTSVFVNLGYAYDQGEGVRRSKRKALYCYRRAAELGVASAAHNIATVYRDRDECARSVAWLRRAVRLGDSGSNLLLGQILLSRFGRLEEALACFRAITDETFEAHVEAGRVWAAVVEGIMATGGTRGRTTRG